MPEGLEAEIWRRAMQPLVGRTITRVEVDERTVPEGFAPRVTGVEIRTVRRAGKVVLLDTTGATIGLHLGMTGRIVVDGSATIERLEYASGADRPEWDRVRMWTSDTEAPALRVNDPRRLGRTSLDPDLSHLGPDALTVGVEQLRAALGRRRAALKAALLDQGVVAGLGNLCVDEVLFAAGLDPARPANSLDARDLAALGEAMRDVLPAMLDRGGSTEGTIDPEIRRRLGPCPRTGCRGVLRRSTVGGRTTVACERHQR